MPLNPADVRNLGNTWSAQLATLIGPNHATPVKLGRTLALVQSTMGAFANDFAGAITACVNGRTTVGMDYLVWQVYKPSFPFPRWLHGFIDASDALNEQEVVTNNGRPTPAALFTAAESNSFSAISKYACLDASAFDLVIADHTDYYFRSQIINRAYRAGQDRARAEADDDARHSAPAENTAVLAAHTYVDLARTIGKLLTTARAGICFTLAWGSAAPLFDRMWRGQSGAAAANPTLTRLEVVAARNHVFIVLNRQGPALLPGGALPDPATWGPDVVQVDTWLGTLGHGHLFIGVADANAAYLAALSSHFDSALHHWRGV